LQAMGTQSAETRCKVPARYKELFGKELKAVMKAECGNKDFGIALQFLAQNPIEAECDMIMTACKGLGTKEKLLGTIICGRSNAEMELLKKKFFEIHTKDLYVMLLCLILFSVFFPCNITNKMLVSYDDHERNADFIRRISMAGDASWIRSSVDHSKH
jgi:hypothetical protein